MILSDNVVGEPPSRPPADEPRRRRLGPVPAPRGDLAMPPMCRSFDGQNRSVRPQPDSPDAPSVLRLPKLPIRVSDCRPEVVVAWLLIGTIKTNALPASTCCSK